MARIEVTFHDNDGSYFYEDYELTLEELIEALRDLHKKHGIYRVTIGVDVEGEFKVAQLKGK